MQKLRNPLHLRTVLASALLLITWIEHAVSGHGDEVAPRLDMELRTLSGEYVALSELRGEVVVVNFWATWCIPCREELPLLESVARAYVNAGVRFVAVSTDDASTRARIPSAIEETGITFDVWTDATTVEMKRLGLGIELPATAVLTRDGEISARLFGVVDKEVLRKQIDRAKRLRPGEPVAAAEWRAGRDSCCEGEEECDHGGDGAAHDHDHGDAHADAEADRNDASLVPS